MSSSMAASAASSPVSVLPSDLLTFILSRFPVAHRLRVLSGVSKRWRAAALGTIKEFKWIYRYKYCSDIAPLILGYLRSRNDPHE